MHILKALRPHGFNTGLSFFNPRVSSFFVGGLVGGAVVALCHGREELASNL